MDSTWDLTPVSGTLANTLHIKPIALTNYYNYYFTSCDFFIFGFAGCLSQESE